MPGTFLRLSCVIAFILVSASSWAKPGDELVGTWKQVDSSCVNGQTDFTATGTEAHKATQDRRVVYVMTIEKNRATTKVKVWTDPSKKKDYCELVTVEDWTPGEGGSVVIANSKLTRKGHGKDTCSGGYQRAEARTFHYTVSGSEFRLTLSEKAREMWTDDKPDEGFCKTSAPVLIFEKEASESGLFKPI